MKPLCTSSNIKRLLLLGVGVVALVLWKPSKIAAFNPQPDPPVFELIAIDPNKTMRLSATCPNVTVTGVPASGARLRWDSPTGGSRSYCGVRVHPGGHIPKVGPCR
jgi:hypothetical protein